MNPFDSHLLPSSLLVISCKNMSISSTSDTSCDWVPIIYGYKPIFALKLSFALNFGWEQLPYFHRIFLIQIFWFFFLVILGSGLLFFIRLLKQTLFYISGGRKSLWGVGFLDRDLLLNRLGVSGLLLLILLGVLARILGWSSATWHSMHTSLSCLVISLLLLRHHLLEIGLLSMILLSLSWLWVVHAHHLSHLVMIHLTVIRVHSLRRWSTHSTRHILHNCSLRLWISHHHLLILHWGHWGHALHHHAWRHLPSSHAWWRIWIVSWRGHARLLLRKAPFINLWRCSWLTTIVVICSKTLLSLEFRIALSEKACPLRFCLKSILVCITRTTKICSILRLVALGNTFIILLLILWISLRRPTWLIKRAESLLSNLTIDVRWIRYTLSSSQSLICFRRNKVHCLLLTLISLSLGLRNSSLKILVIHIIF